MAPRITKLVWNTEAHPIPGVATLRYMHTDKTSLQLRPDILLLRIGQDDAKHATPVGKDMEEAVAHLLREDPEAISPLGQGVDDVRDEGGKEEPQLLEIWHHTVVLCLQAVLDALDVLQEDSGHVTSLCSGHGALLEAAVFCRQGKHTCDLYTQALTAATLTGVLGGEKGGKR